MSAEILSQPVNQLESLQQGRAELSQLKAQQEMHGLLNRASVAGHSHQLNQLKPNHAPSDYSVITPSELMCFEAFGADANQLIPAANNRNSGEESVVAFEAEVDDARLNIERPSYGGLSVSLIAESSKDYSPIFEAAITERFNRSPAHHQIEAIAEKVRDNERSAKIPAEVHVDRFDPREDILGTMAFLSDVGLMNYGYREQQTMERLGPAETLKQVLAEVPEHRAEKAETDTAVIYRWGKSVINTLTIDKTDGQISFNAQQHPYGAYLEVANQAPKVEVLPFVETECAKQLCDLLESVDLMFRPELQMEMMQTGDADRYGSIFTELSRTIAKGINDPNRLRLSNLFVPRETKYLGNELFESIPTTNSYLRDYATHIYGQHLNELREQKIDIEAIVREKFLSVADKQIESEAAQSLVNMIRDALLRTDDNMPSELPVTYEDIHIRDGSCFDVAAYYIGAADPRARPEQRLKKIRVGEVELLEKVMGSHTFLSMQPMIFNGVHLPKGSLFSRHGERWAFLRLTPFSFDSEIDREATGSELAKAYENEKRVLQRIGGATLEQLEKSAT